MKMKKRVLGSFAFVFIENSSRKRRSKIRALRFADPALEAHAA
jgi:hypothetical protein